jgi:hypothetical protein
MRAKEKAKELAESFYRINDERVYQATNPYISRQHSVLCALVAVAEIIKASNYGLCKFYFDDIYWKQVKEELLEL